MSLKFYDTDYVVSDITFSIGYTFFSILYSFSLPLIFITIFNVRPFFNTRYFKNLRYHVFTSYESYPNNHLNCELESTWISKSLSYVWLVFLPFYTFILCFFSHVFLKSFCGSSHCMYINLITLLSLSRPFFFIDFSITSS